MILSQEITLTSRSYRTRSGSKSELFVIFRNCKKFVRLWVKKLHWPAALIGQDRVVSLNFLLFSETVRWSWCISKVSAQRTLSPRSMLCPAGYELTSAILSCKNVYFPHRKCSLSTPHTLSLLVRYGMSVSVQKIVHSLSMPCYEKTWLYKGNDIRICLLLIVVLLYRLYELHVYIRSVIWYKLRYLNAKCRHSSHFWPLSPDDRAPADSIYSETCL